MKIKCTINTTKCVNIFEIYNKCKEIKDFYENINKSKDKNELKKIDTVFKLNYQNLSNIQECNFLYNNKNLLYINIRFTKYIKVAIDFTILIQKKTYYNYLLINKS